MRNKEHQQKQDTTILEPVVDQKRQKIVIIITLAILFLACTIGFTYLFSIKDMIDISDYISAQGENEPAAHATTYLIDLPDIDNIEEYDLKFSARGCVVEVVSGDKVIYSYGAAQSVDNRYIGRVYASVPLTEEVNDSNVKIHLTASDRGANTDLYKAELCPRSETNRYYLTNGSSSFFLALFSLSMVFLIIMFSMIRRRKSMFSVELYLGGALTCFSIILLDGCGHYLIFTSNMDMWNIIFWLSAYLFPFFVFMFFREAETSFSQRRTLLIIAMINLLFFAAATIIALNNIVPLYYLTREYHFLLVVDGIIGIIYIRIHQKNNQSGIDLRTLLITSLIWLIIELLNYFYPKVLTLYLVIPIFDYRSISAILVFYAFCITYSAMTYEASKNRWKQYQQINQLEQRERQLTPYQEMAEAFFENYEGIYYIDVETGAFVCYHQSEEYEKLEIDKSGDDFFEASKRNAREIIYEEDIDYVQKMISKEAVLEGVKDGKRYSYVYRLMLNGQPTYYQIQGKMEDSGKRIIIGVRNINEIMKQEEALRDASKQLQEAKEELRLSRVKNFNSQMQPHFLYNVLSSIQEIIYDDPEYASRLIGSFTVHLRGTIRAMSSDNPISFSEELKNIKAYVEIEKMRLTDRLNVSYDIGVQDFMVAPLCIQPLVENAIKHGIYKKGEAGGSLSLRSHETESAWIVRVIDDGVGFDYDKVLEEVEIGKRDSTGLKNLKFRLEKLMGARLEIKSKPGKGTEVTVTIPKVKKEYDYESNNS